ncbi:hypothetical protein Tco_0309109 [Tanacetum coccineum]
MGLTRISMIEKGENADSFYEQIKVERILRHAADVELVERRIRDYEQGGKDSSQKMGMDMLSKTVSRYVSFVLRELPSSQVPTSCCKALLQAYRMSVMVTSGASIPSGTNSI